MKVMPRVCRAPSVSHSRRRAWGSRPVVGSSRSTTVGSCMSARASIRRCFWAPRERERLPVRLLRALQLREEAIRARLPLGRGQAEVAAVEGQDLADGQVAVEVARLGHDGEAALRLLRRAGDVDTIDEDAARAGA